MFILSNLVCAYVPMLSPKKPQKEAFTNIQNTVLKSCMKQDTRMISFERIHQMNNRAIPEKLMIYKHSLALY